MNRTISTAIAAGAAAAALLCAAPAGAATISRDGDGALVVTATGGDQDRVVLAPATDDTEGYISLYDRIGLSAVTADGCETPSDRIVNCRLDPAGVRVALGDGADEFSAGVDYPAGHGLAVAGGEGNDTIHGSYFSDTLDGEAGNDTIDGSAGADTVRGGDGDDLLMGDHFEDPFPDLVDGGPGIDTFKDDWVSRYDGSAPDVNLTLAGGADDGRPGEGDDIQGIENVVISQGGALTGTDAPERLKAYQTVTAVSMSGGGGNDILEAGGGPDTVDGGAGDDMLDAGYGDDTITGGPGRDRIFADLAGGDCGPLWCTDPYGNDTVYARDGEVDQIDCGAGEDIVHADSADVVGADCETVDRGTTAKPGAHTCRVPRVIGLNAAAARRKVVRAGCRARVSGHGGHVRRQSVRAGLVVRRSTIVRLTLGR
jgi:Ca2+-binding RTX toxin-like protein